MSAPGTVIEDDDNESASSILTDAIDASAASSPDQEISTDDVAKLAAELKAAKASFKEEREARFTIQKTAQEASTNLQSEREKRIQAAEDAVTNGIAAAQADVDRLTAEAARAMEEGRYADAAKFNRQAAAAEIKLEGYEQNKQQLAGERERLKAAPVDPKANLTPETRAWIDAHPRFETDPVYQSWAITADTEARKKGLAVDTPAYFAYVEKRIAQNEKAMSGDDDTAPNTQTPGERAAAAETVETPAPAARSNGASMAAPVSRRATPAPNGGNKNTIKLSADEADAADRMFADRFSTREERLKHYAAMKQRKIEQGAISA